MIKSYISGIGSSLPKYQIKQSRIAEISAELFSSTKQRKDLIQKFHNKSGIATRYSVLSDNGLDGSPSFQSFYESDTSTQTSTRMDLYKTESAILAEKSAKDALQCSNCDSGEIDWVITVSCTGFSAPGLDSKMIDVLKLRSDIKRTHIGFMGCHGLFNGLQVGNAAIQSGQAKNVLIISVELCSLHFNPNGSTDQLIANALFADGSTSIVLSHQPASNQDYEYRSSTSLLIPDTAEYMTWNIGDHGFEMTLSSKVPSVIEGELSAWVNTWLSKEKIDPSDQTKWAIHPGGPKILDSVQKALSLNDPSIRVSKQVLSDYGNMSSATVGFILKELIGSKNRAPIVGMGFGPGLIAEAFLLV